MCDDREKTLVECIISFFFNRFDEIRSMYRAHPSEYLRSLYFAYDDALTKLMDWLICFDYLKSFSYKLPPLSDAD